MSTRLLTAGVVAAIVSLALYFPDRDDGSGAVLGGVFVFAACAVGFAAVARVRPLAVRSTTERLRLLALSIAAGVALGIGNLAANYAIAALDPAIYRQMIEQWTHYSGWSIVFSGPLVEEIAFRLILMGGTAWVIARWTDDRRAIFAGALALSALLFGVAHILPSSRPTTGIVHAFAVAVKSAAGGVLLGWVFWRRGLAYSYACHSIANAVHLVAWPFIFVR